MATDVFGDYEDQERHYGEVEVDPLSELSTIQEMTDLGPEWKEVGYISEDGIDPATQTDYHVPPMLYTGPLGATIPTGKFRIRPEDVAYCKGTE